jgi:poly [ADP-ribose] polymerase
MATQSALESVKLIYVDVNGNNNKVWQAELRSDGLLVQWGRVGAKLQEKFHPGAGYSKFDSLKREKLAKGYTLAQTIEAATAVATPANLKQIAIEQIQADDTAKRLIQYLTEVNIHNILAGTTLTYQSNGTFTTPLGAITPNAIAQARKLLNLLSSSSSNRTELLNQYLRLIPQKLGSRINAGLFSTPAELQKQFDLLDALTSVVPTAQLTEKVFDCSIAVVPHTTDEGQATFRQINRMFTSSMNPSHISAQFKLKRLYELRIPDMEQKFEQQLGNVQQLWHGTKASNLLSILKNGLIIPPANAAQCTGRMFGNGVYFSNQSTKSLNYATNYWNQSGGHNQRVFMLLADVALGKEYRPSIYESHFKRLTSAPKGYHSFWAAPGSCNVINHEAIVYRTSQVNLRYLCEFE